MLKRSTKLCATLFAAAAAMMPVIQPAPAAAREAPQAKPYNIVFVLVDDLRFDMMGFLTPGLKTPNIDFLARNGVYFKNAVVTSSLCSPSRATILTGETVRNHGVVDNNDSSEEGLVFFPSYLKTAGYTTAFIGKWHMGWDNARPRPGFDKWVSFKGQGTYFPTDLLSPKQIAAGERQTLNVDGREVKQTGYITDELTDYAVDWLEHGRDKSKPFFLYLSHKAVHSDATPPDRYKNQYSDLKISLPASMANTPQNNRGKPMWVQDARNSWHGADFPLATNQPITDMVRDIYRTLTPIDDSLGRIREYLKKAKLDRNTMIVFYSDNGYLIGDHGLTDKRNAYEPSIRVPMVVYAPDLAPKGQVNEALVRNLDLAPTFLDMAGVAKPQQMEGASWLPLLKGQKTAREWNANDFVYEYYWEWTVPYTPTMFAIERNRVKYIQYYGVWDIEELYDLNKDPDEMNNLINDPAYRNLRIELRGALYKHLADAKGRHSISYTARLGPGVVQRDRNGTHRVDFPTEWYVGPDRPDRFLGYFPEGAAPAWGDNASQSSPEDRPSQ